MKAESKVNLYWIPLVAFTIRVIWIYISPAIPVSDWATYLRLAADVADGNGFINQLGATSFRPPAYPLILALPLYIFGFSIKVGQWLNVILSVISVFLIVDLCRRIWGDRIALVAGLLFALAPSSILYTAVFASENLAITAMVAAVFFMVVFTNSGKKWAIIPAGMAIGILTLTSPGFIFLPVFFALAANGSLLDRVKQTSLLVLFAAMVIAPWTIRNLVVFDTFIPVSTNGGFNFAISFFENADGKYRGDVTEVVLGYPYDWDTNRLVGSDWTEKEIDDKLLRAGLTGMFSNPTRSISLATRKLGYTIRDDVSGVNYNLTDPEMRYYSTIQLVLKGLAQAHYMLAVLLAVAWIFLRGRQTNIVEGRGQLLMISAIAYVLLLHSVFIGGDRFHLPILPFVYCYASLSLVTIFRSQYVRQFLGKINPNKVS